MRIWVDADACPKVIKEILFSAAKRTETSIVFVANKALSLPYSPFISSMQVMAGFDVADDKIINLLQPGDLVITADIPLADAIITKKGIALNPRGELYTPNNIKHYLAMRNLSTDLRSSGQITGGPSKLDKKHLAAFSNHLDKILRQQIKKSY